MSPPSAEKPAVIITVDGEHHACVVALYSEPQGSTIPCADLIAFLRVELRVASGSIYDIRAIAGADAAQVLSVDAGLKDAGYQFIGGHALTATEPKQR